MACLHLPRLARLHTLHAGRLAHLHTFHAGRTGLGDSAIQHTVAAEPRQLGPGCEWPNQNWYEPTIATMSDKETTTKIAPCPWCCGWPCDGSATFVACDIACAPSEFLL
jgi:hypothetical protein